MNAPGLRIADQGFTTRSQVQKKKKKALPAGSHRTNDSCHCQRENCMEREGSLHVVDTLGLGSSGPVSA